MTTITLPAQCTREAALTLLSQAREHPSGKLTIDASDVETMSQAMLQVLLVVLDGRQLTSPSATLADLVRKVGLGPQMLEGVAR